MITTSSGFIVITSIQPPTTSVMAMLAKAREQGLDFLVVGDRKTPACEWPSGITFVSLEQQRSMDLELAAKLPENHYSRKNIGYLLAMSHGAPRIFDTDDDNAPLKDWHARDENVPARSCAAVGWINAYRWFSDAHIWPRGLPLDFAKAGTPVPELGSVANFAAPIQQGLANGSPDVDAVWRLLLDQEVTFSSRDSVALLPGAWCPFNSQSTWWFPQAYALLYLPSHVSFRMTDIWRSFVAQRCLWALGKSLIFHGPEMHQDRNQHDLMRDFAQEVPGYLHNGAIRRLLDDLPLETGAEAVASNLRRCYAALVAAQIVPALELELLEAWLADLRRLQGTAH